MATHNIAAFFDKEKHSDVTVRFGDHETKCHKVILSAASEYFSKMFDPDSHFSENQKNAVELKEDDPVAVDAMLRYVYNFEYADVAVCTDKLKAIFHLDVYIVAKKYLMAPLQDKARDAMNVEIGALATTRKVDGLEEGEVNDTVVEVDDVLRFLRALIKQRADHPELEVVIGDLARKHLIWLMGKSAFRAMLDTEEGQPLLQLVQSNLKRDDLVPERFTQCPSCHKMWSPMNRRGCSFCGVAHSSWNSVYLYRRA